jgi:hypothetical protein
MRVVAVTVFDRELNSKGRDLPDLKMHKGPKQRGPHEYARKHILEEGKGQKAINHEQEADLRQSVIHKMSSLKAQLKRISASSGLKYGFWSNDGEGNDFEDTEDLDAWLERIHQEREDSRDMGLPY